MRGQSRHAGDKWFPGLRNRFWEMSLDRLLGSLVLFGGVVLAIALFSYFLVDYGMDRRAAKEQVQRLSDAMVLAQSNRFDYTKTILTALAAIPDLPTTVGDDCPESFSHVMARANHLANIGMVTPGGEVICSVRPIPKERSMQGLHFLEQVGNGETRLGDLIPLLAEEDRRPVLHIGRDLQDEDGEVRVLFIAMDPFEGILPEMMADYPERYHLGLIADDGRWLYQQSPEAQPFDAGVLDRVLNKGQAKNKEIRQLSTEDDGEALVFSIRGHETGSGQKIHFLAAFPIEVAWLDAHRQLIVSVLVLLLGLFMAWVVSGRLVGRFVRRNIHPILAGLDRMAESFPTSINPEGMAREMARISRALNEADRQRRVQEQQLKLYHDESPLAVIEWDSSFRVIGWSLGAEKQFGWTYEEVKGRYPNEWDFVHEDDQSSVAGHFQELAKGGSERFRFQNRNWTKDGRLIHCLWFTALIRDDQGNIETYLTFSLDVTSQVRAEEDLKQLNQELESRVLHRTHELQLINQELESFSYSVSHDLRGPLRAIWGFAEALEEDYSIELDAEARHYISRIQAGARKMGLLIDDLLSLARVSRAELNRETTSITELATEICEELAESQPNHPVHWTVEQDLVTEADPALTRILLQNMLENAWKYTRDTLDPQVNLESDPGHKETFVLRDNGAGFDPAWATGIFRPFQRLHHAQDFECTGIGLATVHRIVQRHAGHIEADGVPGGGARFIFSLTPHISGLLRDEN